jgi:hypothetical protein
VGYPEITGGRKLTYFKSLKVYTSLLIYKILTTLPKKKKGEIMSLPLSVFTG